MTRDDVIRTGIYRVERKTHASSKEESDAIIRSVEALDIEGPLDSVVLSPETKLFARHRPDFLGGVTVITDKEEDSESETSKKSSLLAIPYYARDNRGSTGMKVWLPEKKISD